MRTKHAFILTVDQWEKLIGILEKHKGEDAEMDELEATLRHDIRFLEEGEAIMFTIRRPRS